MVRILFPPAASQRRTPFGTVRIREFDTRAFRPPPLRIASPLLRYGRSRQISIPPERCRGPEENSDRIGGFEKGEFERDSAREEVAAQICVPQGADALP